MALNLKSFAFSATASAAPLSATDLWVAQFSINNLAGGADPAYIGDSAVTSAAGYPIVVGSNFAIDAAMNPSTVMKRINLKNIYIICAATKTASLRVTYIEDVL